MYIWRPQGRTRDALVTEGQINDTLGRINFTSLCSRDGSLRVKVGTSHHAADHKQFNYLQSLADTEYSEGNKEAEVPFGAAEWL